MSKPTIFFSHSSKDRDLVLSIKNKLDVITGGTMEIFMSSDGQSIPFGTNWIHKIEEGLKSAKLMFVFVTENSISSGWIYFEAGYAYSKGIQVIPVGIGVDIGALKAPLNLLQGFNVLSEDSLNNFITIVNRTFDYRFLNGFEYSDYIKVVKKLTVEELKEAEFEKIVDKVEFEIRSEDVTVDGQKINYNINGFFDAISNYLNKNNISFSKQDDCTCECSYLVFCGIKMICYKERKESEGNQIKYGDYKKIRVFMSPYNFLESFRLLKKLMSFIEGKENGYIRVHLKAQYSYIQSEEDGSSILFNHEEFRVDKTRIGGYVCSELGLSFFIFDFNKYSTRYGRGLAPEYVALVRFKYEDVCAENILDLINRLYKAGFIFEK